ncbi:MAG: WD40 repeat domain-containing protein [Pirellulaceae bacterium]
MMAKIQSVWTAQLHACTIVMGLWVGHAQAQLEPPMHATAIPVSTSSQAVAGGAVVGSFEIQLEALEDATSAPVVTALVASSEGRFLAVAGDDHAIRIVDVRSGKTTSTFAGHIDWIQCLVFSADQQADTVAPLLYSAGNDGRVLEWKYEFPVRSRELLRLPYAIRSISMSSDKQLLAIGGFSNEILIWDLRQNRLKHKLECDCGDQRCVRFSPDGERVLCGGREGEVRVWDTESGNVLAEYREHRRRVTTAAFSVDGNLVTSVGEDRQLVRFDIATGQIQWRRELAPSKMMSMCLINDSLVAAAGADNSIHLYDALAEQVVGVLEGHTGTVAVMAPCGDFLASGSFDTTVRIWDLEVMGRQRDPAGRPVMRAPLKMDADLRIR